MKKILHTCCRPFAGGVLRAFKEKFDEVLLFFGNSNLNSGEEYNKRLFEVKKLAKKEEIELIEGDYNHSDWLRYIKSLIEKIILPKLKLKQKAEKSAKDALNTGWIEQPIRERKSFFFFNSPDSKPL
jgi:predicted adenine nucleotide alpha hydrolase (AANH) superfamily ATPase